MTTRAVQCIKCFVLEDSIVTNFYGREDSLCPALHTQLKGYGSSLYALALPKLEAVAVTIRQGEWSFKNNRNSYRMTEERDPNITNTMDMKIWRIRVTVGVWAWVAVVAVTIPRVSQSKYLLCFVSYFVLVKLIVVGIYHRRREMTLWSAKVDFGRS